MHQTLNFRRDVCCRLFQASHLLSYCFPVALYLFQFSVQTSIILSYFQKEQFSSTLLSAAAWFAHFISNILVAHSCSELVQKTVWLKISLFSCLVIYWINFPLPFHCRVVLRLVLVGAAAAINGELWEGRKLSGSSQGPSSVCCRFIQNYTLLPD